MHLAYVVNQFPALSETFVSREVVALRDQGVRVDLYTFTQPSEADLATMSASMQALHEETVHLTPTLPGPADLGGLAGALRANGRFEHPSSALGRLGRAFALAKQVRRVRPDRIHAHWPYATMVTHLASLLSGVPYSVSIHAHEVAHENGHFHEVFGRLDFASFCNSAAMEHLLGQLPEAARAKSHLVYHGVETGQFEPLPMPTSADPFRVVSAGRLTRTKGFDRLVRACAKAREDGAPVELAILGRGDEEATIRAVAEETGFTEYLSLPGWVSHDEVPEWIGRSHLFALPASVGFHDGLPNVVLEAMASGRPAILSPLPAAGEAITPGIEGEILESQDDVDGLADHLVRLASDPARVEAMGRAARERVVADHDALAQIKRMHALHVRSTHPGS
ncbi:MAG: glycosyltransferase family 4 protein [Bacteroidota bacterium]